jgi:hypothetical protein
MPAHLGICSDTFNKISAHLLRMRARESYPFYSGYGSDTLQQLYECKPRIKVNSVRIDRLAKENDLFTSSMNSYPNFSLDLLECT